MSRTIRPIGERAGELSAEAAAWTGLRPGTPVAIANVDAHVSVPAVTSDHAVRTKEWTPLEPKTLDNKYYVRGMGTVREIAIKGPTERLELVSFKKG